MRRCNRTSISCHLLIMHAKIYERRGLRTGGVESFSEQDPRTVARRMFSAKLWSPPTFPGSQRTAATNEPLRLYFFLLVERVGATYVFRSPLVTTRSANKAATGSGGMDFPLLYVYIYIYITIYIHICIHIHVYIYIYIYTHVIYIYIHVLMYRYIYIYILYIYIYIYVVAGSHDSVEEVQS